MLDRVVKAGAVVASQSREQAEASTRRELEQARQHAAEEAWARGHAAGRAEVLAEGVQAELRAATALERLVATAGRQHAEEISATSRAVLAAALDVTEWVLRHELPASSRSLLTRLGEAAGSLLPSPSSRVTVSPADEVAVRAWARTRRDVEVLVDPGIAPGDATFDTDAGSVEVSVAAALRIAAETLGVDPARGVQ